MRTREPKGRNLGRAMTILWNISRRESDDYEYGCAMGAPMGELMPVINRGRARRFRRTKRRIKAITGLKWPAFVREVERRTSPRWMYFNSYIP